MEKPFGLMHSSDGNADFVYRNGISGTRAIGGIKEMGKASLDRSRIPACCIMGVQVNAINMPWLIEYIVKNIKALSGDYITVCNVHTVVMAYEDVKYRDVQNGGALTIPDGGPLSTVGRRRGFSDMKRTTGPGLMEEVFQISVEHGYRHYFYGSTPEVLSTLKKNLLDRYPGLDIAGMYSPPFRPLSQEEDRQIIEQINASHADFVWIGLGAPKQENWMAAHKGSINGLMIGVGAGFDYHAGLIKRAPEWMQNANLEWLYRLMQEPKRLFKRYFMTNFKFIWHAIIRGQ